MSVAARFRWLAAIALLPGVIASGGCTVIGGAPGSSSLSITSRTGELALKPDLQTNVYRAIDENTADIYLSDLPEDQLLARLSGEAPDLSGVLVHIHMFIMPRAGQTPIDYTASNVSITQLVMAGPSVGVYGGGGFMLPSGKPGNKRFGGTMRGTTLRLIRKDPGFEDLLGTCEVEGRVGAERDEQTARRIGSLMLRHVER